jgi:hypothetical protein
MMDGEEVGVSGELLLLCVRVVGLLDEVAGSCVAIVASDRCSTLNCYDGE